MSKAITQMKDRDFYTFVSWAVTLRTYVPRIHDRIYENWMV